MQEDRQQGMHALDGLAPLSVNVVQFVDDDNAKDRVIVLHRGLHCTNDGAVFATQLEQRIQDNKIAVVIRSGPPAVTPSVVHASYELPHNAKLPSEDYSLSSWHNNILCWTRFESDDDAATTSDQCNNNILAVLANPTLLCLYEVFPDTVRGVDDTSFLYGSEGWTVSLPVACRAIFAHPGGQGLFLQAGGGTAAADNNVPMSDDETLLPTLYSLQHPLEDVLPVAVSSSSSSSRQQQISLLPVTERVVWTGQAGGTDLVVTSDDRSQSLAIFKLTLAPPPANPPMALHQWTQAQMHHYSSSSYRPSPLLDETLDWELVGSGGGVAGGSSDDMEMNHTLNYSMMDHNEALADALGVSTSGHHRHHHYHHAGYGATAAVSHGKQPLPRPLEPRASSARMSLDAGGGATFVSPRNHASLHLPNNMTRAAAAAPWKHILTPRFQLTKLWSTVLPAPVQQVELVSSCERDNNVLAVLLRRSGDDKTDDAALNLYELVRLPSLPSSLTVHHLDSIPCRAVQAWKDPGSGVVYLIVQQSEAWFLLRAQQWLAPLDPPVPPGLLQPAARAGLLWYDQSVFHFGHLSLRLADPLAEAVLQTLERALPGRMAAAMRVDCNRLVQDKLASDGQVVRFERTSWTVVESIFTAIVLNEARRTKLGAVKGDPWSTLTASNFHREYASLHGGIVPEVGSTDSSDQTQLLDAKKLLLCRLCLPQEFSATVFDAWHAFVEDIALCARATAADLDRLVQPLRRVCRHMKQQSPQVAARYSKYYKSDTSCGVLSEDDGGWDCQFTRFPSPPSVHEILLRIISSHCVDDYKEWTRFASGIGCQRLALILQIFDDLATVQTERDTVVVKRLLEAGYKDVHHFQEKFAVGIVVPILEVVYEARIRAETHERPQWTGQMYDFIGRRDLRCNIPGEHCRRPSPVTLQDHVQSMSDDKDDIDRETEQDLDGLVQLEHDSALMFPSDNRVHEVCRLLRSSRPIFLRVPRAVEISDHEYEKKKQERLQLLCRRALGLPIGRGMVTIGNLLPMVAEPMPMPELCLKGRVPPTNNSLNLDLTHLRPDVRAWPEFHNGVAAGLRLPLANVDGKSGSSPITRTWILYNRAHITPENAAAGETGSVSPQVHAHAGMLFALGMRGHLTKLDMSDIYEYLTQGAVTTTVGVLLGMAANKRGSCDMGVSKMICLHIPSLIPQHFSAVDVASSVQTAAIASAGLLFQGSSHRMMTEFLVNEIGKRPDSEVSAWDREGYTLSCGLALGMVNLCLTGGPDGTERAAGIADLGLENRLLRYIVGGIDEDEIRRTRETNDRFSLPPASGVTDSERCSVIKEGEAINTDLTAPAATLALGLMYMKSGNASIVAALQLPTTHFLLEFVRPDFLAYRVIARSLILWHEVEASNDWIEQQIPEVVRQCYSDMKATARRNAECRTGNGTKTSSSSDVDRRAIRQIYVHIVAGACFAMALRFAGTADRKAKTVLMDRVVELFDLREANDAASIALRPEFRILESCLGMAANSLALVMAGTGDLDALKLFKMLRWRCDSDITGGSHMNYAMSIGLLFLGGGTSTVGNDAADVAALLAAFYPRYPMHHSDNSFHLQALRHLYALAVRRRELRGIDVDTGEIVSAEVSLEHGPVSARVAEKLALPALLRNMDRSSASLRLLSNNFYPVSFDLPAASSTSFDFYVKRRPSMSDCLCSFQSVLAAKDDDSGFLDYAEHVLNVRAQRGMTTRASSSSSCSWGQAAQIMALRHAWAHDATEFLPVFLAFAAKHARRDDVRLIQSFLRHRFPRDASISSENSPAQLWDVGIMATLMEHN